MMKRSLLPAVLALALLRGGAPAARAEIGASGTRLAIGGGAPRSYMTYGHILEPELYAPVVQELKRLDITFERHDSDYWVFHKGTKVAEWPIVTERVRIPETGDEAVVLVMGGNVFVPLRKIEELFPVAIKYDKSSSVVSVVPGRPKNPPAVVQKPDKPAAPDLGSDLASLTRLSIVESNGGVEIRVEGTAPVRPAMLRLTNPSRLVLDFPDAHWVEGVQAPAGSGLVKKTRIGQFTPTIARLALDVETDQVRVTALSVTKEAVTAKVGIGREVAQATLSADAEALIREAFARRGRKFGASSSRDGNALLPNYNYNPRSLDPNEVLRLRLPGSLLGKTIVVDPGHGGKDTGAPGEQYLEKDLCLKMGLELRRQLEAMGARVLMTRESDLYVTLDERTNMANASGADIFISIHCNSTAKRNRGSGSCTYWRTPQSERLAQALHPHLVGLVRRRDEGIRNRSLHVCRESNMPSVLLEIGYINNDLEEPLLGSQKFHGELAQSLALGVLDYFGIGQ